MFYDIIKQFYVVQWMKKNFVFLGSQGFVVINTISRIPTF